MAYSNGLVRASHAHGAEDYTRTTHEQREHYGAAHVPMLPSRLSLPAFPLSFGTMTNVSMGDYAAICTSRPASAARAYIFIWRGFRFRWRPQLSQRGAVIPGPCDRGICISAHGSPSRSALRRRQPRQPPRVRGSSKPSPHVRARPGRPQPSSESGFDDALVTRSPASRTPRHL